MKALNVSASRLFQQVLNWQKFNSRQNLTALLTQLALLRSVGQTHPTSVLLHLSRRCITQYSSSAGQAEQVLAINFPPKLDTVEAKMSLLFKV